MIKLIIENTYFQYQLLLIEDSYQLEFKNSKIENPVNELSTCIKLISKHSKNRKVFELLNLCFSQFYLSLFDEYYFIMSYVYHICIPLLSLFIVCSCR